MSSATHDLISAGRDSVDAVSITLQSKLAAWWSGSPAGVQVDAPQSMLHHLFRPQLPALLSPLPSLFRLVAFLIVAPVIFICLVDFAGYAIFRTLGFHRRRVRVKRKGPRSSQVGSPVVPSKASSVVTGAPVLTPGTYDADTLLRHRARSASASSAEAIQEWTRTGGTFARVSNVRASKEAASNASPSSSTLTAHEMQSPPDSPRNAFGRAGGVGVEGALGYFDTDAEDSGVESGRSSPEVGRKGPRRGLGGGAFGFTPVSSEAVPPKRSLGLEVPLPAPSDTADPYDRSPRSNDSVTSSWIRLDDSSNEDGEAALHAAMAADLEPTTSLP